MSVEVGEKNTHSTVLIVSATETKTLNVANWKLKWVKPIIGILAIASIALAVSLSMLAHKHVTYLNETATLKKEVKDLKNATSSEIETKLAELNKSQVAIKALQDYLKERGVEVPEVDFETKSTGMNDAAGGPEIKLAQPIPYMGEFSSQVYDLLDTISTIPFGRPHDGALSSGFGPRSNPFGLKRAEFHGGLDFRGKTGEPIKVTANGVVDFAGVQRGYGNVVIVKHKRKFKTYYAHLSAISVKKGQQLSVGDVVGKLGSTGRSTGPHLHYEVRINNDRKNPKPYINF